MLSPNAPKLDNFFGDVSIPPQDPYEIAALMQIEKDGGEDVQNIEQGDLVQMFAETFISKFNITWPTDGTTSDVYLIRCEFWYEAYCIRCGTPRTEEHESSHQLFIRWIVN